MQTTQHEDDAAQWWEAFYGEGRGRWSGKPNRSLVDEVSGLTPGTALDLGCGEGGDALWLAEQGWQVTAVDLSPSALARAARNHAAAGIAADAISWEQRDIGVSLPAGRFDLVTATFLHSPVELPRTRILRAAADAVSPGGTLLVIGHMPSAAHPHVDLPTPDEVIRDLALPADGWQLRTNAVREVQHAFRDEPPTTRLDGVVRFERLPG